MVSKTIKATLLVVFCLIPIVVSLLTDKVTKNPEKLKQLSSNNATPSVLDFVFPDSPALNALNLQQNVTGNITSGDDDYDDDKIGGNAIATILG